MNSNNKPLKEGDIVRLNNSAPYSFFGVVQKIEGELRVAYDIDRLYSGPLSDFVRVEDAFGAHEWRHDSEIKRGVPLISFNDALKIAASLRGKARSSQETVDDATATSHGPIVDATAKDLISEATRLEKEGVTESNWVERYIRAKDLRREAERLTFSDCQCRRCISDRATLIIEQEQRIHDLEALSEESINRAYEKGLRDGQAGIVPS